MSIAPIKHRVHTILEPAALDDTTSRVVDIFIMVLIITNVVAVILGTVQSITIEYRQFLYRFEVFSICIFTVEYLLRLWSCTEDERYRKPFAGRIRYATRPMALVDLAAIVPFYLPLLIPVDLRILRILRLSRLFRVFKFGRYSDSMNIISTVIRDKKEQLLICLYTGGLLLILAASAMYYIEYPVQPEQFPNIPAALWWGVATLTTVGYGDVYPITPLGKSLGALIAILGIGMFALPAGILASGFSAELEKRRHSSKSVCPHCGRIIEQG